MTLATSGLPEVGSFLPVSLLVGVALVMASVAIAKRVGRADAYPALTKVIVASAVLHLLCAPAQIFVVDHFYGGIADWLRYDHQGAILAASWRTGHFTLAGSGVHRILGDGSVSIFGGIIMMFVGPNQLAAFFVSAWLAFVGSVLFYRAFAVTFPEADRRRYALLVFFFPSLLFWTADVSKEAIMLLALGLTAYGMARVLARLKTGYPLIVAGGALALVVRPDELILLVIGFAVAMLFRPAAQGRRALRGVGSLVFVVGLVAITATEAARFVHAAGGTGLTGALNKVAANNHGVGAGFGSSTVTYSANPLWFPRDLYTVLFDPLPVTAHSITQLIAATENLVILGVIVASLAHLALVPRASRHRPYVLVCLIYSIGFIYLFAALGNLGLITRERTLLLPFLLVLLALPVAPDGRAPYPWQRRAGDGPTAERTASPAEDEDPTGPTAVVGPEWWAEPGEGWSAAEWEPADWTGERAPDAEVADPTGPADGLTADSGAPAGRSAGSSHPVEQPAVDVEGGRDHPVDVELGLGPPAGRPAHGLAAARVGRQLLDRPGQRPGVVQRDQQAGHRGLHHLPAAPDVGGHDRHAAGRRLHGRAGEALAVRGQHEQVERRVDRLARPGARPRRPRCPGPRPPPRRRRPGRRPCPGPSARPPPRPPRAGGAGGSRPPRTARAGPSATPGGRRIRPRPVRTDAQGGPAGGRPPRSGHEALEVHAVAQQHQLGPRDAQASEGGQVVGVLDQLGLRAGRGRPLGPVHQGAPDPGVLGGGVETVDRVDHHRHPGQPGRHPPVDAGLGVVGVHDVRPEPPEQLHQLEQRPGVLADRHGPGRMDHRGS